MENYEAVAKYLQLNEEVRLVTGEGVIATYSQ